MLMSSSGLVKVTEHISPKGVLCVYFLLTPTSLKLVNWSNIYRPSWMMILNLIVNQQRESWNKTVNSELCILLLLDFPLFPF